MKEINCVNQIEKKNNRQINQRSEMKLLENSNFEAVNSALSMDLENSNTHLDFRLVFV